MSLSTLLFLWAVLGISLIVFFFFRDLFRSGGSIYNMAPSVEVSLFEAHPIVAGLVFLVLGWLLFFTWPVALYMLQCATPARRFMRIESWNSYLFEYNYDGSSWSFEVPARDEQEARERVSKLANARYLGEIKK